MLRNTVTVLVNGLRVNEGCGHGAARDLRLARRLGALCVSMTLRVAATARRCQTRR